MTVRALLVLLVAAMTVPTAAAPGVVSSTVEHDDDLRSLEYGQTVGGTVDEFDPTRDNPRSNEHAGTWYYEPVTFEGAAGDVIELRMHAPIDASLVLVGPNGDRIADNEDGGPGNDSAIVASLPSDGRYTVQATSHYPGRTFDYVLSLEDRTDDAGDDDPMTVGERRVGVVDHGSFALGYGGYFERVPFEGADGQLVAIDLRSWTDSRLYLRAPNGSIVASDVATASGRNARVALSLPQSGEYTVIVGSDDRDGRFAYEVAIQEIDELPETDDAGASTRHHDHGTNATNATNATNETHADTGSGSGNGTSAHSAHPVREDTGADVRLVGLVTNRSTAAIGEPVALSITVANVGTEAAEYATTVTAGENRTVPVRTTVGAHEVRTIEVTTHFERPGTRTVGLANGSRTRTVAVVDPTGAPGETVHVSDDRVVGYVADATGGGTIPFDPGTALHGDDVTFDRIDVTPPKSGTVWLSATYRTPDEDGVPSPGDAAAVLQLDGEVPGGSDAAGDGTDAGVATIRFTIPPSSPLADDPAAVAVRQYDPDAEAWEMIETERVSTGVGGHEYVATVERLAPVAIGRMTDPVTVDATIQSTNITPGEAATVTVLVENRGSAETSERVDLAVDGETVTTETVSVPAGDARSVTISHEIDEPGERTLSINGEEVGTVQVSPVETPERSAATTPTPTATPTSGSGPGFGIAATLLAVLGASLLLRRRWTLRSVRRRR